VEELLGWKSVCPSLNPYVYTRYRPSCPEWDSNAGNKGRTKKNTPSTNTSIATVRWCKREPSYTDGMMKKRRSECVEYDVRSQRVTEENKVVNLLEQNGQWKAPETSISPRIKRTKDTGKHSNSFDVASRDSNPWRP
jgi:hypothetical protein